MSEDSKPIVVVALEPSPRPIIPLYRFEPWGEVVVTYGASVWRLTARQWKRFGRGLMRALSPEVSP